MTSGSLCLSFCACSPSDHVDLLRVFSTLKDGSVHDELFLGGKEWVNGDLRRRPTQGVSPPHTVTRMKMMLYF